MRQANDEIKAKERNQEPKSKKARQRPKGKKQKPKEAQKSQEAKTKRQSKEEPQKQQPNSPTHYESLRFVPGPQFGDRKRQEGASVIALATPAGPPAADCGTASPCGGRLYGGPARGLTFGLLPNKWIKRRPFWHQEGMERNARSITFFTERTLAAYLAVSDRTIRNWIRRGDLPSYKLGASRRIDPADVDAFLAQRREAS
ncbi:MAG TPA: helix-turn-helix domain-containing protein [Solirubrobacterales bacterium]|nr:helix-turn-helix domain-containing protein [Solirubrobacterales bacterium]